MMNILLKQMDIRVIINKEFKGSITVEAAISFTLTVFILFLMLGPLLIIKTTSDLIIDMDKASKVRCNYQMIKYITEDLRVVNDIRDKVTEKGLSGENLHNIENIVNYTALIGNFLSRYDESKSEYRNLQYVYDLNSEVYDIETGIVKYDYDVFYNLPYNVLHIRNVKKRLVSNRRAFIGVDGDRFDIKDDSGEYIYLANNYTNSSVYHTFVNCTYLIKNTFSFKYSELSSQRNDYNEKFTKCDYCFKKIKVNSDTICYGTHFGDKYHYRANCPLMTAYVTKVPIEYIERYNLRLCEKCRKKGE